MFRSQSPENHAKTARARATDSHTSPVSGHNPSWHTLAMGVSIAGKLATIDNLQRTIGNRVVARLLQLAGSPADIQRGTGQPLGADTRHFFRTRMGRDFAAVRGHTDSNADRLCRAIRAKALTTGTDIAFQRDAVESKNSCGLSIVVFQ